MPQWNVYHSEGVFKTAEEKKALVHDVNNYYHVYGKLPAFYVVVNFLPMPAGTMFRGYDDVADLDKPFVRLSISHMAAHRSDGMGAERFRRGIDGAIKKSIVEKGYYYEYSVVEEPREMWKIDGLMPPPYGSEIFMKWNKENKVSDYTEGNPEAQTNA
ncbi:hypothetical protein LTR17_027499 [Elasticomyces elasticus]|nr:hypothetical protein LTR17_027499 [Elasticomyces elasticus]